MDDNRLHKGRILYSEGKPRPLFRGVFHAIFACTVPIMLAFLIQALPDHCESNFIAYSPLVIFCSGHVACWGTSAIYHRINHTKEIEIFFQKLDHALIYIMIFSCWYPLAVYNLEYLRARNLIIVLILGVAVGFYCTFVLRLSRPYVHVLYGCLILLELSNIQKVMTEYERFLLQSSISIHVLSAIQFAVRRPFENHLVFSFHEVFHIMNIVGAILFACMIYLMALRGGSYNANVCVL